MSLEKLFDRSPVLPVDATISLARYLRTIRQTQTQAQSSESAERGALLHIRILQLICKTLPSHPEYGLAENKNIVRQLRAIAHASFASVERLADVVGAEAEQRGPLRRVEVATGAIDLFERIAAEGTARGVCTLGLLAGRVDDGRFLVTALVIPSQTATAAASDIRYETDVTQLLEIKRLTLLGLVHLNSADATPRVPESAEELVKGYSESIREAFAIAMCSGEERLRVSGVSEEERLVPARHVEIMEGVPQFKLYDLRPLAVARDEQRRQESRG